MNPHLSLLPHSCVSDGPLTGAARPYCTLCRPWYVLVRCDIPYPLMSKLSKAERMELIHERLANRDLKSFQTEADKQAAKGKRARRKGESFQERIATDLKKIGNRFGFDEREIYSRSVTGHGEDIVFCGPLTWDRFGRPVIEAKHYKRKLNLRKIFKQHAQKRGLKKQYDSNGIPILVYRYDYQPILAMMRQDDLAALSGDIPETRLGQEALVTVPWEDILELLSRKVVAGGPVGPSVEPIFDGEDIPL